MRTGNLATARRHPALQALHLVDLPSVRNTEQGASEVIRVIPIDKPLARLRPDHSAAWSEWLLRYQLNACLIPLGTTIVIDDADRTIRTQYFATDEDGKVRWDRETKEAVMESVIRRLESPALPCPDGMNVMILPYRLAEDDQ